MRRFPRFARPILIVAWLIFLTGPLVFLFAHPAPSASLDWFAGIYTAFTELFGEQIGRWVFCGSWLALNALVFWRVMLSKPEKDVRPDVDLDG
jgi:hypothetical protein